MTTIYKTGERVFLRHPVPGAGVGTHIEAFSEGKVIGYYDWDFEQANVVFDNAGMLLVPTEALALVSAYPNLNEIRANSKARPHISEGDWISFGKNGGIVIGRVAYITSELGRNKAWTVEHGCVAFGDVLEVRRIWLT